MPHSGLFYLGGVVIFVLAALRPTPHPTQHTPVEQAVAHLATLPPWQKAQDYNSVRVLYDRALSHGVMVRPQP
ncbi:hypothetical protein [Magnetococcus marinus]|uniref:hypothetical protein n=1 Tax=Magnetococcus marinus TaxID=1124597 RepID=UPI00003C56A4|nr:hypothetical protein [Magnetococcus marinus]